MSITGTRSVLMMGEPGQEVVVGQVRSLEVQTRHVGGSFVYPHAVQAINSWMRSARIRRLVRREWHRDEGNRLWMLGDEIGANEHWEQARTYGANRPQAFNTH